VFVIVAEWFLIVIACFFKSKSKANLYQIKNFTSAVSSQALSSPSLPQILQKILHQNQLLPTAGYQNGILQLTPQGYQNEVLQQLHQNPWQNATG